MTKSGRALHLALGFMFVVLLAACEHVDVASSLSPDHLHRHGEPGVVFDHQQAASVLHTKHRGCDRQPTSCVYS